MNHHPDQTPDGARGFDHPVADHLDLNLLSAMVEGKLAGAERETLLLHLSACADCRELLALVSGTAPVEVEDPVQAPETGGRWWQRGWRVPAFAALGLAATAGAVLLVIHRQAPQQPTVTVAQQVPSESPAEKAPEPEAEAQSSSASAMPEASKGLTMKQDKRLPAMVHATPPPPPPIIQPQAVLGAGSAVPKVSAHGSLDAAGAPQGLSTLPMEVRAMRMLPAPAPQTQGGSGGQQAQSDLFQQQPAGVAQRTTRNAYASPSRVSIAPQAAAAAPVSAAGYGAAGVAPAPVPQANETVTVSDSAVNVETASTMPKDMAAAKSIAPASVTLPSGLQSVTLVRTAKAVVALDSRGNLFSAPITAPELWRAVQPQWIGTAVLLRRITPQTAVNSEPAKSLRPWTSLQLRTREGRLYQSDDDGATWRLLPSIPR